MQKRKLGNSGLEVSAIGLRCDADVMFFATSTRLLNPAFNSCMMAVSQSYCIRSS